MYKLLTALLVILLLLAVFLGLKSRALKGTSVQAIQIAYFPPPTPFVPKDLNSEVLWGLVNNWRVTEGLKPFVKNDYLCKVAKTRIPEVKIDWSHNGMTINRICKSYCHIGENLARYTTSEEDTLFSWEDSPEHLKNLKDNFTYSCIETDGSYAVQLFATF